MMVRFIDDHRQVFGVESICAVVPIAPSTYFRHKAQQADPSRRSARAIQDDVLKAIIRRIWEENHRVYGPRTVWRQMGREHLRVARCRVRRVMRALGLAGAVRGRAWVTTTQADPAADRPSDLVSSSLRTDFVLDALDQAIYERCGEDVGDLIHHSDRGSQYLAMRYTDRLTDAGIEPSVGSRGDAYDCEHDGVAVRPGLTPAYE
jgi:putative transposase